MLKENDNAPGFTLKDSEGKEVSLADYSGKWIVVYFYPKADTPGCTVEAIDFTTYLEEFKAQNATILGISADSESKLEKFCNKHNLKITLLSDPDHEIIEQYGAWVLKKMYGREYMGIQRSTFLINPEGKIEKIWGKVRVKGHVEEVKNLLVDLNLN